MKKSRYIVFGLILGVLLFSWQQERAIFNPVDSDNFEKTSFLVKNGQSVSEISSNLKKSGLIRSDYFFKRYLNHQNLDTKIVAGRFLLSPSLTAKEIAHKLSNPSDGESILTIQEGLRITDIDEKLVELELIKEGEFLTEVRNFDGWEYYDFLNAELQGTLDLPLEGYLYPDTYFLDPIEFQPHDLIYLALDNFEEKINELEIPKERTFQEIVTMASIIENEVFGAKDRQIVSGILWKRLDNGWPIGADATLLYITDDREISGQDLNLDSPYNTRKFQGLPPGPISNPSLESLQAAASPVNSEYWFYLTTLDTGKVIYAKSNEEHNVNRAKYL
jgi:UPF0755 protein